jgi:hypothetical protein
MTMTAIPRDRSAVGTGYHGAEPEHMREAHRDVLAAVEGGLAANWALDRPRVAVIERDGVATVYVSTLRKLDPGVRSDIRGAVRAALAPYLPLAPYTDVVFLRRLLP